MTWFAPAEKSLGKINGWVHDARQGERVSLPAGPGAPRVFDLITAKLGPKAAIVRVPHGTVQTVQVPLAIARACGHEVTRTVARLLAEDGGTPDRALKVLAPALRSRVLCVEGLERLGRSPSESDARDVVAAELTSLRDWLNECGTVVTTSKTGPLPVLQPRAQPGWQLDLLWRSLGKDPERFTLALALCKLRRSPNTSVAADSTAVDIADDVWDALPLALRDVVALLTLHGRPIFRSDVTRLGVIDGAALERCVRLCLIEDRGGVLHLPATWAARLPILERAEDRATRHRAWAEAFEKAVAVDAPGLPAAVATLEAHRHFAAIPDVKRALEHAHFGASVLLDSAVAHSKARAYVDAVALYEAALALDRRVAAAGSTQGLGVRLRAYTTHYRHFNAHEAKGEPLSVTLRGYEISTELWRENALFWARLIHTLFLAGREVEALAALSLARDVVPRHDEKLMVLVARTAEWLQRDDHLLAAVFVWRDHRPSLPYEHGVRDDLERRIAEGFEVRRLWAPGVPSVDLVQPSWLEFDPPQQGKFVCRVGAIEGTGRTWADAITELVRKWPQVTAGVRPGDLPVGYWKERLATEAVEVITRYCQDGQTPAALRVLRDAIDDWTYAGHTQRCDAMFTTLLPESVDSHVMACALTATRRLRAELPHWEAFRTAARRVLLRQGRDSATVTRLLGAEPNDDAA